jgi:hypothetical protein
MFLLLKIKKNQIKRLIFYKLYRGIKFAHLPRRKNGGGGVKFDQTGKTKILLTPKADTKRANGQKGKKNAHLP